MKRLIQLSICLSLLVLSSSAIAGVINPPNGNAWDLWTYGNGSVIRSILEAVKLLTAASEYTTIIATIAVGGFLALSFLTTLNFDFRKLFLWSLGIWFLVYAIMDLRVNINVIDPVSEIGLNVAPPPIADVPAAVGFPAIVVSNLGHTINRLIEQFYNIPGELKLSQGAAFNMAATTMNDMTKVRFTDSGIRSSMIYYMNDCVIPMVFTGAIPSNTLLRSQNLWADVESTNVAILTRSYLVDPQGDMVSCAAAYTGLNNALLAAAPSMVEGTADVWHQTNTLVFMTNAINSTMTWLSNNAFTGSAQSAVLQSAVLDMYKRTYEQAAMLTGNSDLLTTLNMNQAVEEQRSGWVVGAELFRDLAGYLYAVLQAFVLAIAPLVLVGAIIPNFAATILGSYLRVLAWLVLWEPALGLVNFIMQAFEKQGLEQMFSTGACTNVAFCGPMSLDTVAMVSQSTANSIMVSGFLATLVPLITWHLVSKGGVSFTEFISKGIASGASAAKSMASGDFSAGNVSMDNTSMGKHNFMRETSLGYSNQASIGASAMTTTENLGGYGYQANTGKVAHQSKSDSTFENSAAFGTQHNMVKNAQKQNALSSSDMASIAFSIASGSRISSRGSNMSQYGKTDSSSRQQLNDLAFMASNSIAKKSSHQDVGSLGVDGRWSKLGGAVTAAGYAIHELMQNSLPSNFSELSSKDQLAQLNKQKQSFLNSAPDGNKPLSSSNMSTLNDTAQISSAAIMAEQGASSDAVTQVLQNTDAFKSGGTAALAGFIGNAFGGSSNVNSTGSSQSGNGYGNLGKSNSNAGGGKSRGGGGRGGLAKLWELVPDLQSHVAKRDVVTSGDEVGFTTENKNVDSIKSGVGSDQRSSTTDTSIRESDNTTNANRTVQGASNDSFNQQISAGIQSSSNTTGSSSTTGRESDSFSTSHETVPRRHEINSLFGDKSPRSLSKRIDQNNDDVRGQVANLRQDTNQFINGNQSAIDAGAGSVDTQLQAAEDTVGSVSSSAKTNVESISNNAQQPLKSFGHIANAEYSIQSNTNNHRIQQALRQHEIDGLATGTAIVAKAKELFSGDSGGLTSLPRGMGSVNGAEPVGYATIAGQVTTLYEVNNGDDRYLGVSNGNGTFEHVTSENDINNLGLQTPISSNTQTGEVERVGDNVGWDSAGVTAETRVIKNENPNHPFTN